MNILLEDVIQLCHERHAERGVLRQRKTVVTPALYKRPPFQIKVHCARANALTLNSLENANISFMPIGHATEFEQVPPDCGGERFTERQRARAWRMRQWHDSWGIQIYTGIPSSRDGANWHDFEFKYEAICIAPDDVVSCLKTLLNTHANPLLTLTKSGGLRFSCRVQEYLHANTAEERFYIYKDQPTEDNPDRRVIYLEVLGNEAYSQWDMRYEILLGDLLDPPVITKEVLFATADRLRAILHESGSSTEGYLKALVPGIPSFGSANLERAKSAFLKRGFSYLWEKEGAQQWIFHGENGHVTEASLWEDQGIVWVRASTQDTDIPTNAVAITDIWDDTGILVRKPVSEKILAIRGGNLSALAIKRPPPRLHKQKMDQKSYQSIETQSAQLQEILKRDTRILALTSSDVCILNNTDAETHLLNSNPTCINIACRSLADATVERYATKNLESVVRWRSRLYGWDQVKDIPADIRMANPFQHGNICENPEPCMSLMKKGGNPNESFCPKCPVYNECLERGHLSQPQAMQSAYSQISPIGELFLHPRHTHLVQQIIGNTDEQHRIYIIDERKTLLTDLFLKCNFSKKVIEEWVVSWKGYALGSFAVALMHTLETQYEQFRNPIGQIRTAVEAFDQHADEIIEQMCYVNVRGKVIERKTVDPETGSELSHYGITLQTIYEQNIDEQNSDAQNIDEQKSDGHNGKTAYIPLDANAKDRLHALGLLTLSPDDFSPNEDISIPMQMAEAIRSGFLDVQSVESIESFPSVCMHPEWTYWHQLKLFFEHYKRDADAPMQWCDRNLVFWLPPMLHPEIKRLLIISPFLNEQQLGRMFPEEETDVIRVEPTAWLPGNKVFQIRTSSKTPNETLNLNSPSSIRELSKMGERYDWSIRAEIERDLSIKHAIFSNRSIVKKLSDLSEMSNVCFMGSFKSFLSQEIDIEGVQVLWLIGLPRWRLRDIWQQAQMLYGNDDRPLNYNEEIWVDQYKDARIQELYDQNVSGVLKQIVGRLGMNRHSGKTVMMLNNFDMPDITDRPETVFFDWEDFEIAGGLDKLEETICTRERFEIERDNITADTPRKEVERILGCSSRQANRVLNKLRGGNIPRVSFREQILFLLSSARERTTASLVAAIDSSPQAIGNELKRLLNSGEIVRVRRGVYSLPQDEG